MVENLNNSNKVAMKQATKGSPGTNPQPSCKKPSNKNRSRKVNNPKQLREQPQNAKFQDKLRICGNFSCRKVQPEGDKFCKRCSCCICGKFDDNKDPDKWLGCKYVSGDSERDKCDISCHVECALEKHEVGVVYHGPSMLLDGGYHCCFCGTVSGILDFWKKQVVLAKYSQHLDTLSYKINLSCRLLDGTLKFKELHEIVKDAKAKLESEIGPTDMDSAGRLHGLVGRLSVAEDVRNLCSLAIEKADQLLVRQFDANPVTRVRACSFVCDEVTLSSVRITVFGMFSAAVPHGLRGYKLWHYKTKEEIRPKEPTCVISTMLKTVTITGLQPSTEYTFCVAAYSEAGDWGHSETNCVTKGDELVEIYQSQMDVKSESLSCKELNNTRGIGSSEHRVRDLGTLLRLAGADKLGSSSRGLSRAMDMEEWAGNRPGNSGEHNLLSGHNGLDLNVMTVPDLNEEVMPPCDSLMDGEVNVLGEFHGNGESFGRSNGQQCFEIPPGNGTTTDFLRKNGNSKEDMHESDSTLSNMREHLCPPWEDLNDSLEHSFEHCIKTIRRLECEGHISPDLRLKLLTWFCMRSTQYERRLVHLFIDAFDKDPDKLARQLAHSFPDILSSKRPKNGCLSGKI